MPFIDTNTLDVREPLPGWTGRFFNSDTMTFAYYTVTAGSSIHEHRHESDEVWHIIEGEFEVTLDGETRRAGPGTVAVVPSNKPHSMKALTDGRAIVADHPRRSAIGGVSTG